MRIFINEKLKIMLQRTNKVHANEKRTELVGDIPSVAGVRTGVNSTFSMRVMFLLLLAVIPVLNTVAQEQMVYPCIRCLVHSRQQVVDTNIKITIEDHGEYKVMHIGDSYYIMDSQEETHTRNTMVVTRYNAIDNNDSCCHLYFVVDESQSEDMRYSINIDYSLSGTMYLSYFTRKPYRLNCSDRF